MRYVRVVLMMTATLGIHRFGTDSPPLFFSPAQAEHYYKEESMKIERAIELFRKADKNYNKKEYAFDQAKDKFEKAADRLEKLTGKRYLD